MVTSHASSAATCSIVKTSSMVLNRLPWVVPNRPREGVQGLACTNPAPSGLVAPGGRHTGASSPTAAPHHAAFLCKSAGKVIHRRRATSSQDFGNCFPRERPADAPMGRMQPTPGTAQAPRRQAVLSGRGVGARGSPFRRPFPAMCNARHQANRRARLEARAVAAHKANNRGKT